MKTDPTLRSLFVDSSLRLLAALLLLPALGLGGCGEGMLDGNQDLGDGDNEIRISATDTENWANLTVQLPNGTCLRGGNCTKPLGSNPVIKIDGAEVGLGSAKRLKPGAHSVSVDGVGYDVTLSGGQARTVTLPVAHIKCSNDSLPNVQTTDFGSTPALRNAACPTSLSQSNQSSNHPTVTATFYDNACRDRLTSNGPGDWKTPECQSWTARQYCPTCAYGLRSAMVDGVCVDVADIDLGIACSKSLAGDYSWVGSHSAAGTSDKAFAPGTYRYQVEGEASPVNVTLNEGDVKEIAVQLPVIGTTGQLFSAKVQFKDQRALPDAAAASITSSVGGERHYTVPTTSTTTLDLKAYQNPNAVYTFNAAGRSVTLSQTSSNTIRLNRVDVDDVTVTRENGSTYQAKGTYELYFGGNRVAGPFKTNSGIDVLPGDYELVLSYTTADGQKTQRFTLNY